jgi:hypothetical protein
VLHNLHYLVRRSEESYKGEGFSSQEREEDAVRARRLPRTGFSRRLPDDFCLARHPMAHSRIFRAIYALPTQFNQWRPLNALEGLATAKDPRDPSLANPGSHTNSTPNCPACTLSTSAKEGESSTQRGIGSARYRC